MSDPYDLLKLDNQLCFAFYVGSRSLTRAYREFLEPLDLTYPQYLVLLVLLEEDNIRVSQVGSKLMLDSGTLTPLLRRLEAMGLITRARGVEDERTLEIRLTEKAFNLRQSLGAVSHNIDCKLGMTQREIQAMRESIMSVVASVAVPDESLDEAD